MAVATRSPAFASLVLDVDFTLTGVEGIDWLAARRGPAVTALITRLTQQAMSGEIPLENVYGDRLSVVRPTSADLDGLAQAYKDGLAPGAFEAVHRIRAAGVRVVLVSGGIWQAILPLSSSLGFADDDLHAVRVYCDEEGEYVGYDTDSPLATAQGKPTVVAGLGLPEPVLAVGDGATDLAMRPIVDTFAAYTGFAQHEAVVRNADHVVNSFQELERMVVR